MALEHLTQRPSREEHLKHIRYSLLGAKYELEQAAGEAALIHFHSIDLKLQQALQRVNSLLMSDALKP